VLCPSDQHVVSKFAAELRARIPGARIIVFGSRARGTADADSDLDVLVVVEAIDTGTREIVNDAAWAAGFPDVVVAPVIVARRDLESGPGRRSVFFQTVLREGLVA